MPTPACRAIALRDALVEAAKAERAAVRMRSRLVRASFLDGVWCAGGVMAGPFGVIGRELARAELAKRRGLRYVGFVTEGSPFHCGTGGGRSWPGWFWLPGAAAISPAGVSPNCCGAVTRCARRCGIRAGSRVWLTLCRPWPLRQAG